MEIKFSSQETGACPLCEKYDNCRILKRMRQVFLDEVTEKYDNQMEVVIYRCPEFKEK